MRPVFFCAHLYRRGVPDGRLSPHYLIGGAYLKRAENVPAGANAPRGTNAGEDAHIQEFLDMIAPSVIKFETDHFICGNTYRCVWALREYPTATDEQAILSHLGEKDGVTLRIYTRRVTPVEERKIMDLCQYFGQKKSKDYAIFLSSSSSFCCGVK